jgi:hypothetical protein
MFPNPYYCEDFNMMKRIALLICGLLTVSVVTACGAGSGSGADGDDTVYLRFVHGYPGAGEISLYGPQGSIFSGLEFGKSTTEPIELSRNNQAGQFRLIMQGAPQPFGFQADLFSMYPQETATIFLVKRSSQSAVTTSMFRHTPFLQEDGCILTVGNALSLTNDELGSGDLKSYTFQTQWEIEAEQNDAYRPEDETSLETRCGVVDLPERYQRNDFYNEVLEDVDWFYPVESDEGPGFRLVKGVISRDNNILAHRTTDEYMECLQGAVSFPSAETNDGGDGDGNDDGAASVCPSLDGGPFEDSRIQLDQETVEDCKEPAERSGIAIAPDENVSYGYSTSKFGDRETCSVRIRPRTSFVDVIFERAGEEGLATQATDWEGGRQNFVIAYGRPVNPLFKTWTSVGDETGDVGGYPGGISGNYDNEGDETPTAEENEGTDSGESGDGADGEDNSSGNGSSNDGGNGNGGNQGG